MIMKERDNIETYKLYSQKQLRRMENNYHDLIGIFDEKSLFYHHDYEQQQ